MANFRPAVVLTSTTSVNKSIICIYARAYAVSLKARHHKTFFCHGESPTPSGCMELGEDEPILSYPKPYLNPMKFKTLPFRVPCYDFLIQVLKKVGSLGLK